MEVANKIGVTTAYLSVIENGAKIPKLETCIKLLNALNISADAAFMDCIHASLPKKTNMIQAQIGKLSPEKQKFVITILQSLIDAIETK